MAYLTGVPLLWLSGLLALMAALALLGLGMSQCGGLFDMIRFGPLAALGLTATACFLYLATGRDQPDRVREAVGWVEQTHGVIVASERLLSAVQNTEMGQRNFLITREAQFVQEWEAARSEVWNRFATLRVLIQSPQQQQRLTELERLIAARLKRLAHGLEIARADDFEEALASVRDGDGNRLMQDVHEALDVIIADEDRRLGKRSAAADAEQHRLNEQFRLVTGAGVVLFVLFGGALAALRVMRARTGRELAIAAERLKGEATLRASEARLRRLIDAAPVAIAMFDREMRYIAASRRFITDCRLDGQELVGRCHYDVFPDLPERWREIHQRCLQGAVESSAGERFARADGTLDWIRWEIQPWHDARGAIGGIVLFSEDITDRKHAEEALFHEKERAQVTLQSIGDAVITTDKQSRVEYLNPVAEAMTGWSCVEAAGQPLTTVFRSVGNFV